MTNNLPKKAIFPVAGLGTRFLPATKATPKEMLPIVDKPLIQYAVEEAIAAGITELIFVTSYTKRAIEDHFDSQFELEYRLAENKQFEKLEIVKNILPPHVSVVYVRQAEPKGLGHAVGCAKDLVGDEPFAVILADDLIMASSDNCLMQLITQYKKTNHSVIAVEPIAPEDTEKYGVIQPAMNWNGAGMIAGIVEKPKSHVAPSQYGVVGRYVLTPAIFKFIENAEPGAKGEIQLTDAIAKLIATEGVSALAFEGKRYDCGSKMGYLKATVDFALQHPEVGADFRAFLAAR